MGESTRAWWGSGGCGLMWCIGSKAILSHPQGLPYCVQQLVKIVDSGLYFSSCILFYFFLFIFLFISIFRTTWVRVDRSCCHISHNLMAKSQDWSQDIGEGSRRFWNKVMSYNMDNTCWPHVIHMVFRVGCTVVSMDHK